MLSFEEFSALVENGESLQNPGKAAGYVRLDGFYGEWLYDGIEADDDGEVTPAGWEAAGRQDAEHLPEAYEAYKRGEAEYRAIKN